MKSYSSYVSCFLEIIIILCIVAVTLVIAMVICKGDYIPSRIKQFCQATKDVYGTSYDECIASYNQHAKEQK
jgi:hypothetical protein